MLKPSELTPSFSELLRGIVAEFFSPEEFVVAVGGVEVAQAFSRLPFDHLFFTGSTAVGRQIALAAAENLTPVTLELGGKSPAIIDADCDMAVAAPRLAYGKLLNAGQTCVAPDYVLVPRGRVDEFVAAVEDRRCRHVSDVRGRTPITPSIVSDRHYQRLNRLVDDATARGATAIRLAPAGRGVPGGGPQAAPRCCSSASTTTWP